MLQTSALAAMLEASALEVGRLLKQHGCEFEQFEPRKFVAQGDTVVVLGYERSIVKSTGRSFEQEWALVYTLRDGKIATGRFFEDTAAEVVAFGAA